MTGKNQNNIGAMVEGFLDGIVLQDKMLRLPREYANNLIESYDTFTNLSLLEEKRRNPTAKANIAKGLEGTVERMKDVKQTLSHAQKYLPAGTFAEQIAGLKERIEAYDAHD